MKNILLLFFALVAIGCKNYNEELCRGKWVLIEKWDLNKKETYKPSKEKIVMQFNVDGTFIYMDTITKVGYHNKYEINGDKLTLNFEGLSNKINGAYKITKLDSNFLFIDTSPGLKYDVDAINYMFVKHGGIVAETYEGFSQ